MYSSGTRIHMDMQWHSPIHPSLTHLSRINTATSEYLLAGGTRLLLSTLVDEFINVYVRVVVEPMGLKDPTQLR